MYTRCKVFGNEKGHEHLHKICGAECLLLNAFIAPVASEFRQALLAESEFKSNLYHLGVSPRFASEGILYFILFPGCVNSEQKPLPDPSCFFRLDLPKQGQWLIYLIADASAGTAAESFAPCYSCQCCCCRSSSRRRRGGGGGWCGCRGRRRHCCWWWCCCRCIVVAVAIVAVVGGAVVVVGGAAVVIEVAVLVVVVVVVAVIIVVVLAAAVVVPSILRSPRPPKASPKRMAFGRATKSTQTEWKWFCLVQKPQLLAAFEAFRSKKAYLLKQHTTLFAAGLLPALLKVWGSRPRHGTCKTAKHRATETSNACKTQPPTSLPEPYRPYTKDFPFYLLPI